MDKDFEDWTCNDVAHWMNETLELPSEFGDKCLDDDIDGGMLMKMTFNKIKARFKNVKGARTAIYKKIHTEMVKKLENENDDDDIEPLTSQNIIDFRKRLAAFGEVNASLYNHFRKMRRNLPKIML